MRLIDADKLPFEPYGEDVISWYATGWNDAINVIDRAPTVDAEPVRHAEWIPCVINGKETKLFMTCSGCKRYQWPRSEVPLFRRCPKCGAIMGGSKRD